MKAVVYSSVVQHGPSGGERIVRESIIETGRLLKRSDPKWQSVLISEIYKRRILKFMDNYRNSLNKKDYKSAKSFLDIAENRLPNERKAAQAILIDG